ncbi:MAG: hypothetical protein U0636_06605 [Phycisphaerales bacterium]
MTPARTRRWLAVVCGACALGMLPACATTVPVADRTLAAHPKAWVAVVPRAVRATPEFAALLEARKREYATEVVEYDPAVGTPAQRLALVQSTLRRIGQDAAPGHGYALLVGSPDALPMAWRFQGVDSPVLTDMPLGALLDAGAEPIPAAQWRAALTAEPAWLVGRIPYDQPPLIAATLSASCRQMAGTTGEHTDALLASDGVAEAWVLAVARGDLRRMGWTATLAGNAGSCDQPATDGLCALWRETTPELLAVAAPSVRSVEGGGLGTLLPGQCVNGPAPGMTPALGALLAGGFGEPSNDVLRSLFEQGWLAGACAFTETVDGAPLAPWLRLQASLPVDLGSDAPLGNCVESARRRFWVRAEDDVGMLFTSTRQARDRAALALVTYGDPALRCANSVAPGEAPAHALVVPGSGGAEGTSPAAGSGTAPTTTAGEEPSTWPRWAAFCGLLVFVVAVLLWLFGRKQPAR